MKTEDIDKRIGMPDVDKEWARFEQEVISEGAKRHSALAWALGIGIAASVALLIIYNIGKEQTEQPLVAQVQPAQPEHVSEPARVPAKEVVAEVSKPVIAPRKELALAKADAPATTGLDIPAREYTGAVQKFKMDDIEDLAFESVDQALQGQIAERDIASADLGSGTTMRLRGTGSGPIDKDRIDSTLILVNGEPLPDSLKQRIMGNDMDDIDTYMPRYFSQQGLMIDSVYVHKDSYYTEKYGGRAKYGMIEIKVVPDTYCDAYVRKHPKLMKKYTRVEGYVMNNEDKPLTEAWVHVKRERALLKEHPELDFVGAATDSTGHYVIWLPKDIDITLCAEQTGYKSFEFSPSDKNLVMQLETGASMRLRGNPAPTPELQGVIAGLPDAPPNDSILYIVNGVPQPKENNKWLSKRSFLDYFHGQHLLVDSVKRNMNEEAKQRYIERFGMAAKHGVVEYFCVEDTLCDYYMNQHEELKASRRRVSGVVLDENDEPLDHTIIHILQFEPEKKIWGFETTDSLGNFAFWVPRTGVKMHFTYIGYKTIVIEPTDTFLTVRLVPNSNVNDQNLRLRGNPKPTSESQGQIAGLPDTPPNDSILYLINGKPQPKENNKWLSKDTYLDYFKKQHLHVERVMDYTNVKQRYIEKFGEAAKYGVVEYICVEDTRGDYYMEQHEELKANRRRVSGVVLDENDKPLGNTKIFILHDKKIWGTETTDSSGNFAFWVPRTDVKLDLTHYGYKPVVVEPTDTFQTIHLLPTATMQSTK